ncbi:MAG: hypothetical protein IT547_17915 [Hyphomonadaceae bacterium]|nr:hypothetical protein [Hyphomonadaceae bacterium]
MAKNEAVAAEEARERFEEAVQIQAVEGNPFAAEDHTLFAEFEREGLSDDEQRARIIAEAKRVARPLAAE